MIREVEMNGNHLELIVGDITRQKTEAIVNAANGTLLGGGGVDGAIHRAAGVELLEACKKIRKDQLQGRELSTGDVVMTKGYQLPANFVIHTVGPIWGQNPEEQDKLLANCYRNALQLAKSQGIQSISFPSISTGVYRFPIKQAASIAMQTIIDFLKSHSFGRVTMVLFSEKDYHVYQQALDELI